MSTLKLDKNTVSYFEEKKVSKIKIFFYDAGCSGNKIDISDDFEISDNLILALSLQERGQYEFDIYIEIKDKKKLEDCSITRVVKADHTGKEKVRYIYTSEKVFDRCGCGTSFAFEKKQPKINLEKLKILRDSFNRK